MFPGNVEFARRDKGKKRRPYRTGVNKFKSLAIAGGKGFIGGALPTYASTQLLPLIAEKARNKEAIKDSLKRNHNITTKYAGILGGLNATKEVALTSLILNK